MCKCICAPYETFRKILHIPKKEAGIYLISQHLLKLLYMYEHT